MAKPPETWGIYYIAHSTSEVWQLAFTVDIATEADFIRAEAVGSELKASLRAYAVRLLKGHTDPELARETVRALGRVAPLTIDQEIEMQARYMSWVMTGGHDWAAQFAGALHRWRRMPLVERLKHSAPKEEKKNDGP